ncbi:MAG: calcium/sodium antiporter [Chloroflexota bacterium]|jgi:cation:H+ antiporter
MAWLTLIAGLVLLIAGGEALVRGSSRLAAALGVSPLIIGLTVVAFGTSSPELAVSILASLSGQGNIAIGNVIGSNIFNILFILGISALIAPLVVSQQLVRLDVPLMVIVSLAVLLFALDGRYTRLEGLVLVLGLAGYIALLFRISRRETREVQDEYAQEYAPTRRSTPRDTLVNLALVGGGLGLLVLGSRWLVDGAVTVAYALGVSDLIIGLTIVAAGTSMPEVVTSIIAALRGERDIAVGNVVGSNLFNLLSVFGLTILVTPGGIEVPPGVVNFDLPVMTAVAFACLPIFFAGRRIGRWKGGLFLGYYIAYTLFLVLDSIKHDALPLYNNVMFYFILPLTLVTLVAITSREVFRRRQTDSQGV